MKQKIAVFTAWPELLHDAQNNYQVHVKKPVDELVFDIFGTVGSLQAPERCAAWIHDNKLYPDFEYCLYVNHPVNLDLHDLFSCLDNDETTSYIDPDRNFVFYRRGPVWKDRLAVIEKYPTPVGIIFIDCWQYLVDRGDWSALSPGFDFYKNMKKVLHKYQPKNLVFYQGDFGDEPLSHDLGDWYQQGNAVDIQDLQQFERHYQARQLYNWVVVGAQWQTCTHDRPLGFYNLLDLKNTEPRLRIFSHGDCTAKLLNDDMEFPKFSVCDELDYQQDLLIWRPSGRLYELAGKRPKQFLDKYLYATTNTPGH